MVISLTKNEIVYLTAIATNAGHGSIKAWLEAASADFLARYPSKKPIMLKAGRKAKGAKS